MPIALEDNGMYILLESRGDRVTFHWRLFLVNNFPNGVIHHVDDSTDRWEIYVEEDQDGLLPVLRAALKIGVCDDTDLQAHYHTIVQSVGVFEQSLHFREEFSDRVWLKEVLWELYEAGYIHFARKAGRNSKEAIEMIEKEATQIAMLEEERGTMVAQKSQFVS